MSVGKGGQTGSQSGYQSNNFSGTTDTTGTSQANSAQNTSGSTSVTAPGYYTSGAADVAGTEGQTAGQQAAGNYYGTQMAGGPGTYGGTLAGIAAGYTDPNNPDKNAYTTAMMRQLWPSLYTTPTQAGGSGTTATAGTGAAYMAPYMANYTNDVVDATQSAADRAFANNMASLKSQFGGAWGGSGSQVAGGQAASDYATNLAPVIAGIKQQGFTTAVGAGSQDAAQANTIANANADRTLGSQEFNTTSNNDMTKFDAGQADTAANRRLAISNAAENNVGQQAAITSGAASGLGGISAQQFSQWLQGLAASVPLFGQDTTGSATGSQTGSTSGTTNSSGTSSGTSSGNSSSKGGGLSFG